MAEALAVALVKAQRELPAVEADKTNPHFGNAFVSLDHLIAKTKPVLTKHGLSIVQMPSTTTEGAPGLKTILLHESGESIQATVPLILAKQDMQGLGAALTYARRYGWASALGICDEADDDGNAASAPEKSAEVPAPGVEPPVEKPPAAPGPLLAGDVDATCGGGAKYAGKKVRDLTEGQLKWIAGLWAPEGKPPWQASDEQQKLLKEAVVAYMANPQALVGEDDIPF